MNITPLSNRVVIEVLDTAAQSAGGIFIPDTAQEKPYQGRILAIGKDVQQVQVGNQVLFSKYGGSDIKVGDREVKIMSEKDILAILNNDSQ